MYKTKSGFTLVELLIVIVVIAILAAITIVAYNGIQAKAKLAQQTAQLDMIGKAIQLWSAENGTSFGQSGVGYNGQGYGAFTGNSAANGAAYRTQSIQDLLTSAGYLSGQLDSSVFSAYNVLLAPCTTINDNRWVVLATVSPAPKESVADQITDSGCNSSSMTLYSDPNGSYKRNLLKAY